VSPDVFLRTGQPMIGERERAAVDRVLRSGMLAQGPEVAAFEAEFACHFGLERPCVAVNSGTSALHLGLLAAGVGPGAEVIVPSFTFAATANAVALTGATPVFADIDLRTFCLDPRDVEQRISERTVGIMPVHLYGHPADMPALEALAAAHGLQLFEDAAQAHGARLHGRPVGTFGTFGAFSLYPTKNMTAGEGGMLCAGSAQLEQVARLLRNQGMLQPYHNELVGLNNRMTDVHAAIGRVQLTRVDGFTAQRRANAAFLDQHLNGVTLPKVIAGAEHVYHQYTVRVPEDRDRVARALEIEHGIGCGVFYPVPVHRLPSFAVNCDLPVTEQAARECLSLPVHPALTQADLERIVTALDAVVRAGASL
jgi:perosamine synthetase